MDSESLVEVQGQKKLTTFTNLEKFQNDVQTQKIGEVFQVLEAKFVSRDQCYKMLKLHVAMQEVDKLADDASCNDTTVMVLEEVFQSQSKSREREPTNLSSFRAD